MCRIGEKGFIIMNDFEILYVTYSIEMYTIE